MPLGSMLGILLVVPALHQPRNWVERSSIHGMQTERRYEFFRALEPMVRSTIAKTLSGFERLLLLCGLLLICAYAAVRYSVVYLRATVRAFGEIRQSLSASGQLVSAEFGDSGFSSLVAPAHGSLPGQPSYKHSSPAGGKVWHVTPPNSVILTLEDGTNQSFKIPSGQKFTIEGQQVDAFCLRKGMVVTAAKIVEAPETVVSQHKHVSGTMPTPPQAPPADVSLLIVKGESTPAPAAVETAAAAPQKKLPKTASDLPLVGLLGMVFIAASLGQ